MMDAFIFLAPVLLLAIVALVGLAGCSFHSSPDLNLPSISPPLSPQSGSAAGGDSVTINGGNFVNNDTVTFGGVAATVTSLATGSIVVTTPAHSPGAVDVVVTNTVGNNATASQAFTYGMAESGTTLNSKPATSQLKLDPVQGQLVVLCVVWGGAGTLTVTATPAAAFTLVNQADLGPNNPPNQPVHVAVFFANNLASAIAITATLTGGSASQLSLVATAYNFVDPSFSAAGQFNSAQGAGTNIALPLSIPGLTPGGLIYTVVATLNATGILAGTITPPADPTVITRTQSPIPGYLLVDDHVVLPQDTTAPYNITATASDPAGSWYVFGMRIRAS
jgi:hypothetical protein